MSTFRSYCGSSPRPTSTDDRRPEEEREACDNDDYDDDDDGLSVFCLFTLIEESKERSYVYVLVYNGRKTTKGERIRSLFLFAFLMWMCMRNVWFESRFGFRLRWR